MNNLQLSALVNSCPETKSRFKGVFAVNTLPRLTSSRDTTYICNLDKTNDPGSHWVSVYVPKSKAPVEYFDSYGLDAPPEIEQNSLKSVYVYNTRSLQQPFSAVCGYYALYFVWQRPLHESMDDVLDIFDECYQYYNDSVVTRLVETHFDV